MEHQPFLTLTFIPKETEGKLSLMLSIFQGYFLPFGTNVTIVSVPISFLGFSSRQGTISLFCRSFALWLPSQFTNEGPSFIFSCVYWPIPLSVCFVTVTCSCHFESHDFCIDYMLLQFDFKYSEVSNVFHLECGRLFTFIGVGDLGIYNFCNQDLLFPPFSVCA